METRSTLVVSIAALAAAFVAVVVLDLGGVTPLAPIFASLGDAASSSSSTSPGGRTPSVHDLTRPLQRIAFGSCNDQSMEQPLWKNIAAHAPELWLWMGDNVRAKGSDGVAVCGV